MGVTASTESADNTLVKKQPTEEDMIERKNSLVLTAYPVYYIDRPDIKAKDIECASNIFHIITSGFWTGPFLEKKKFKDFKHSTTTTWFYELFYEGFFNLAPDARPLFENISMFTQGRLLVGTLSLALDVSSKPDVVNKRLIALTERHNEVGVKIEHYGYFGEALFGALSAVLGPLYDEGTGVAWLKLYSYMLGVMIPVAIEYAATKQT